MKLSVSSFFASHFKRSSKKSSSAAASTDGDSSTSSSLFRPHHNAASPRSVLLPSFSARELEAALRHLGAVDAADGVDLTEAELAALLAEPTPEVEEELREAFAVFDADGDGKISAEELRRVLETLGMTSPSSELRVLETSRVGPPPGSVPESSLPFTFFDIAWLYGGPVQRVFFYRFPCSVSHFMESLFPALKSALSLTLRDFYPLAGKVRLAPGSQSHYELHYAEGDCVPFVVAEHDGDFDDLSGCHQREYTRVRELAPQIPEPTDDGRRPVMALQVTLFPNKGLALAIAVHHSACDGSSSTRFVSSWACRASGLEKAAPALPSFDRSSVPNPNDTYSKFLSGLEANGPNVESMMVQFAPPEAVIGTVALAADDLGKLKATISSGAKNASFLCSTIVATYAYAWVSLVKARAPSADSTVHLAFPGNCRARLQPALPEEYFGNCIGGNFAEAKAGDLTGEDGVAVAARIIGELIEQLKAEPLKDADKWTEKYRAIAMHRPLTVAGSPGFKVYDVDFGWGRPVKVDMPSITWLGAISVAESRDESGGVEIGLVAPKTEVDQFQAHFSQGLKMLHQF